MINGQLYMRSKGAQLFVEQPENLFKEGIEYIHNIKDILPDEIVFYAEYLKNRKHNSLVYGRIPENHLMLFGAMAYPHQSFFGYSDLKKMSAELSIECVPLIFCGKIKHQADIITFLDRKSILGGAKIEGVIVKNYNKSLLIGNQIVPLMCGKYVTEEFKEIHREKWQEKSTGKGLEGFFESFKTNARWNKAVQHLREKNLLNCSPQDIGPLIKAVQDDIITEEEENIKDFLWKHYNRTILRYATSGIAEWYKRKLLNDKEDKY